MEDYEKSIADLLFALDQNDEDPVVLQALGKTYYAFKKYKKCVTILKLALANQPHPDEEHKIYYLIGLAYARVEKFEKAVFPFSKCVELKADDVRYIHERAKSY